MEYSRWQDRLSISGDVPSPWHYGDKKHRLGIGLLRKLSTGLGASYSVTACGLVACSRDPSLRSGQALREHVTGFSVPAGKKHPRVKSTRG